VPEIQIAAPPFLVTDALGHSTNIRGSAINILAIAFAFLTSPPRAKSYVWSPRQFVVSS
jgi:hypothetical protein